MSSAKAARSACTWAPGTWRRISATSSSSVARALAGAHQVRHAADGGAGLQVAQRVADQRHVREVDAVALADQLEQPGQRLAAAAAVARPVRAEEDRVDAAAVAGERLVHLGVDRVERRHVEQAARQARLVRRHDRVPAGVVEPRDRLERAGDRHPLVGRLDVVVAILVDRAVAIEDDELQRRCALSVAQLRQVGDAVHRAVQPGQQREPIGAQRRILGVDHHVVEEGVDRPRAARPALQRRGVVAARRSAPGASGATSCSAPCSAISSRSFSSDASTARRLRAFGLLQDVADALVGRGERGRFVEALERAHRLEALRHLLQRRALADHRVDACGRRRSRRSWFA